MGNKTISIGSYTTAKRASVDEIVGALHTIDVLHHEIHDGEAYSISKFWPVVADGATVAMLYGMNIVN